MLDIIKIYVNIITQAKTHRTVTLI